MSGNPIRVGIVGAGFIGALHANAWNSIDDASIVAICDAKKLRAKSGSKKFKVVDQKWYTDVGEMLADADNPIDVVDVCVPTPYHLDVVKLATGAGKHCVIEKPLARTVEQCEEIIDLVSKADVKAFPAHVIRYARPWLIIKEAIAAGEIGALKSLKFYRVTGAPSWGRWFFDEKESGSIFLDLVIHDIDISRFIVGADVNEINGEGYRKEDSTHETWDAGTAYLSFANSVTATCYGSWITPNYVDNGELKEVPTKNEMGECIALIAVGDGGTLEYDGLDTVRLNGDVFEAGLKDYARDIYTRELDNFVNHLLENEPLRVTLEDGKIAVSLALQALDSSKS